MDKQGVSYYADLTEKTEERFPWWSRVWCGVLHDGHDIELVESTPSMHILRCRRCRGIVWESRVETQEERKIRQLVDVLQRLYDYQNGCPLPSYEAEWSRAMSDARALLSGQMLSETENSQSRRDSDDRQ